MANALRHAAQENAQAFCIPSYYISGATTFGVAAVLTELVEPFAGVLFGTPLLAMGVFVYNTLSCLGESTVAKIARMILASFASIAVSLLITSYFGFTITLAQGALLSLAAAAVGVTINCLWASFQQS